LIKGRPPDYFNFIYDFELYLFICAASFIVNSQLLAKWQDFIHKQDRYRVHRLTKVLLGVQASKVHHSMLDHQMSVGALSVDRLSHLQVLAFPSL
jgi:hypothetical protein